MIFTSIWAFIITIAVLVVFHEFGHYLVARLCGVKVLRFSVGFGKVLYSRHFGKGETEWVLSAIPLGGYVKMLDEREGEVAAHELDRAFNRKPVWQRMAVVAAGPAFNLLLAVILYFALFTHGIADLKPRLGDVPAGTPAAQADFQPHETLLSINGTPMQGWDEVVWRLVVLSLRHGPVEIVGRTPDGVEHHHTLDLAGIKPSDLSGGFMSKLGLQPDYPPLPPVIGKLVPGDVAEQSGLRTGDRVLSVDGHAIATFDQWADVVRTHPDQRLHMELERDGKQIALDITPRKETEDGKVIGRVGAYSYSDPHRLDPLRTEVRYGVFPALGLAVQRTWDIGSVSLEMLGRMAVGQASLKNLSGPVGTAKVAGESVSLGFAPFIFFLAAISVGVGVLNLLPIPILDGGHLLYYTAEFFMRRPVPESAWETGQKIGAVVLLALMILVFYNDISRLMAGG
jgi:regulator of sigma E protease